MTSKIKTTQVMMLTGLMVFGSGFLASIPEADASSYNVIQCVSGKICKGTSGDDLIRGTSGNDTIFGNGGNDKIFGYAGNDYIYGNNGKDILMVVMVMISLQVEPEMIRYMAGMVAIPF